MKSEAEETYAVLRPLLKQYSAILTTFQNSGIRTNAITVIISGNRPRATLAREPLRHAAIDGRLPDLEENPPASLVPWISDNWSTHFKWRGQGALPGDEKEKLKALVDRAHQQGRRVRFWGIADTPAVWRELRLAGVDLLNADDLAGLQSFFRTDER